MEKLLYCRFDTVGKFFYPVQVSDTCKLDEFIEINKRSCIRITDEAQKAYIRDIEMFMLGIFEDTTAKIELLPEPKLIAKCKDWLGDCDVKLCKEN